MTTKDTLIAKGCSFPDWIDVEVLVATIMKNEGPDLYKAMYCTDTSSSSRFLNKFFPNKPKGARYGKFIEELLHA